MSEVDEYAERPGIRLQWVPATRMVLMTIAPGLPGTRLTADDAAWVLEHVKRWTEAGSGAPYAALVDCRGLTNTDPGWRAALNDFYKSLPRGQVTVAWYNLSPLVRIMAEMSAVVAQGIDGKAFHSESEARAWLRKRGFA